MSLSVPRFPYLPTYPLMLRALHSRTSRRAHALLHADIRPSQLSISAATTYLALRLSQKLECVA
eukprot:6167546-Pleurochrysis_carterae.AAC.1